jgi:Fe2+ or Zn2+ uptake regulation protein
MSPATTPVVDDVHRTADERLRRDGQRYTANRRALVDVLATGGGPLTMAEVLAAADGLAQSSAYRNLAVLEEAGVVHRLVTADDTSRYELAEDLTGHHHHLICTTCGAVADIDVPAPLEKRLTELARTASAETGWAVAHHRLDLLGTCPSCEAR